MAVVVVTIWKKSGLWELCAGSHLLFSYKGSDDDDDDYNGDCNDNDYDDDDDNDNCNNDDDDDDDDGDNDDDDIRPREAAIRPSSLVQEVSDSHLLGLGNRVAAMRPTSLVQEVSDSCLLAVTSPPQPPLTQEQSNSHETYLSCPGGV